MAKTAKKKKAGKKKAARRTISKKTVPNFSLNQFKREGEMWIDRVRKAGRNDLMGVAQRLEDFIKGVPCYKADGRENEVPIKKPQD